MLLRAAEARIDGLREGHGAVLVLHAGHGLADCCAIHGMSVPTNPTRVSRVSSISVAFRFAFIFFSRVSFVLVGRTPLQGSRRTPLNLGGALVRRAICVRGFAFCISSNSLSGSTRTMVIMPIIPADQFLGRPKVSGFSTASSMPISMKASCGKPGTLLALAATGEEGTCGTPMD